MTPKMVAGFRRSLSFPNHPNSSSSSKPKKTFHVRSTSLPCRSHPLISQLRDDLNALMAALSETRTSAWLCDALARLKTIHESLDDLLQLPQTRESLHAHAGLVENLLEDFLRFVDVYGIFQTMILRVKEEHQGARVAVRRKDAAKLASFSKSIKNLGKEMEKLIPNLQSTATDKYLVLPKQVVAVPDGDAEVVGVMKDAVKVTVMVSTALFNGLSVSFTLPKSSSRRWMVGAKRVNVEEGIEEFKEMAALWGLRRKGEEEDVKMVSKRMHEMEDCIGGIESGGEKVFRSLINARVSLLNVFTQ
nr:uncharacterized protein LOC109181231 [Ipomoea batatas]